MIEPADIPLTVHRNAPFPSNTPWVLRDKLTGVPIDLTGATITMQVRAYEGADGDPLLEEVLAVVSGPAGTFGPPSFSAADHSGLVDAALADGRTLKATLRLRHDVLFEDVPNEPDFIGIEGFYDVRTGINA